VNRSQSPSRTSSPPLKKKQRLRRGAEDDDLVLSVLGIACSRFEAQEGPTVRDGRPALATTARPSRLAWVRGGADIGRRPKARERSERTATLRARAIRKLARRSLVEMITRCRHLMVAWIRAIGSSQALDPIRSFAGPDRRDGAPRRGDLGRRRAGADGRSYSGRTDQGSARKSRHGAFGAKEVAEQGQILVSSSPPSRRCASSRQRYPTRRAVNTQVQAMEESIEALLRSPVGGVLSNRSPCHPVASSSPSSVVARRRPVDAGWWCDRSAPEWNDARDAMWIEFPGSASPHSSAHGPLALQTRRETRRRATGARRGHARCPVLPSLPRPVSAAGFGGSTTCGMAPQRREPRPAAERDKNLSDSGDQHGSVEFLLESDRPRTSLTYCSTVEQVTTRSSGPPGDRFKEMRRSQTGRRRPAGYTLTRASTADGRPTRCRPRHPRGAPHHEPRPSTRWGDQAVRRTTRRSPKMEQQLPGFPGEEPSSQERWSPAESVGSRPSGAQKTP